MIKAGQKVRIYHFWHTDEIEEGVVKFVHPTNGWFSVEHGTDDYKWLTSFKFDDIGKTIRLVKG